MEPEGSSPRSQVPATCSFTQPGTSSPYDLSTYSFKINSDIILPSTPRSSLRFPHQNHVCTSLLRCTCCTYCPSNSCIKTMCAYKIQSFLILKQVVHILEVLPSPSSITLKVILLEQAIGFTAQYFFISIL